VNVLPTVYTVSGGGTFCSTGSVSVTLSSSQTGVNYQLKLNGVNNGAVKAGTNAALSWTGLTSAGSYTVVATNATTGCIATMSGTATATSNPNTVGGTLSASYTGYFVTGTNSITLSGHTGTVQRWEYNTGSSWVTVSPNNTTATLSFTNLTATTSYRAAVKSGVCNEAYSATITITIYPNPIISYTQQYIPYGGSTVLSASAHSSYAWKKNGVAIGGNTQTLTVTEPADYTVSVTMPGTNVSTPGTSLVTQIKPVVATPGTNLHSVTNILQAGVTNSTSIYTLPADKISQTIDYQDGYGRTFQVVAVGQSPDANDVVMPTGYSSQGLVEKSYLPYVATSKDGLVKINALRGADLQYTTSEQYQFYQTTPLIATDAYPYAVKVLAPSPLANLREQGASGLDWQPGSGHTIKNDLILNVTSQVRYWKPDGTTATTYAANSLLVSQVTDENGNKVLTFTDKLGRTILKQVQMDETLESVVTPWLETYYIYDEYNRLNYIVPPKAMKVLGTGSSLNVTTVPELIHSFVYDSRGRLVEKKVPGAVVQYIVYDQFDRVALTQDGNLRSANKWNFVKYDVFNRPVYAGIYLNATQITRPAVQALFDAINYSVSPYFEVEQVNATYQGYSNQQFPTTDLTVLTVNYYDHYDFDRNATADYSYDAAHLSGQETSAVLKPRGLPTGSKRVVFDATGAVTTTWLINVVFYDKFDRAIQTVANNHLYTTVADKTTIIYDFVKVLKSKTTHYQNATTSLYFIDRPEYDHAGRVLKSYRQINTNTEQLLVQYVYNKLGQVIDKKLHDLGGSTFLQSVDFRYNIRGWLKSINNAQLTIDSQNNDETGDYFGMELLYNAQESGLTNTPYYNGNISATKWKGLGASTGSADQRSYKYTYDKSDRLKSATFQAYVGTTWSNEVNTLNETMTYDHNGNIKTLVRNQNLLGNSGITITSTAQTIDNLTYSYASNLDKLTQVEDAATATGGFLNPVSTSSEYTYNTDGSQTKDDNKGISSITYNVLGKPLVVTFSGTPTKTITYTYDAAGNKLKMVTLANSVTTTTDYVGGFVYTNNALSFFSSPEGRVVKNGSNYEYQYAIADHQGNTRVLFSSASAPAQPVLATFEGDANDQANLYTNVSNVIPFGSANHTPGGSKVVRMNQTVKVGPSKSLRVYPGDKVDMEVWAYHESISGNGTTTQSLTTMISAVAGVFGGVSGGIGESGSIYNGINSAFNAFGLGGSAGDTQPSAYLNYILVDKDYKLLDMGWTRVAATAFVKHKLSIPQIVIKQAGFIFVYLSYEGLSNNYVYFDDMKVTYTPTNVVQYNEYYPFGLQTANSWTRENNTGNNFLANGGTELNTTSNLYDLQFRNYDPTLGRMNQVDPMATKYASLTPYNFAFNDPVFYNDVSGAEPSAEQRAIWETERKANTEKAREDVRKLTFNNRYMYGVVGDDDLFPKKGVGRNYEYAIEYRKVKTNSSMPQRTYHYKTDNNGNGHFWSTLTSSGDTETMKKFLVRKEKPQEGTGILQAVEGIIFDNSNPYLYVPTLYFAYNNSGNGVIIYYDDKPTMIVFDAKGNFESTTEKSLLSKYNVDVASYLSNKGFTQLPRDFAKSSVYDALGSLASGLWDEFINNNGQFLTNKPIKASIDYLTGKNINDITFRFIADFKLNSVPYHIVVNSYYK
jgi:RHS repeat-associated protein